MIIPGIKIPWQVWACAGLLIAFLGWGELRHWQGKQKVQKEWDASIERGKGIVAGLKSAQHQVTTKVETVYVDKIKVVYEKGETITKLIPKYIPAGTCDLPAGFRLLHDAAVTGTLPDSAGEVDAQPVSVETATATVTDNYTTCKAAITELEGLRTWVQDQRQLYLEQCKQQGVHCSTGS